MARYRDAIKWIAQNDDTEWLRNGEDTLSVTASMVADLFGKSEEKVKADLVAALEREELRVRADVARRLTNNA